LKPTAQTVSPDSINVWGYILEEGGEDPYDITSGAGYIDLYLTSIPPDCDYDLELYDSDFSRVARSANWGNADEHIYYNAEAGYYIILVIGYLGYDSTDSYHLYGSYPHAGRPDLIVQTLTSTKYSPTVGEYIDITMTIKNQGFFPAYVFHNGVFYNLSTPPLTTTPEDWWLYTYELKPGDTDTWELTNITTDSACTWHMYALADCDGEVAESIETNNYRGPVNIQWNPPPAELPDLVIQDFVPSNYLPVITEHCNVTMTIKNQGDSSISDLFYNDVFSNRSTPPSAPATGYAWKYTPGLGAGQSRTLTFYKSPTSWETGTWHMWGLTDSDDDINEGSESNNAYGPVDISWTNPPSPHYLTLDEIMNHAIAYDTTAWICTDLNAWIDPRCNEWSCDYVIGNTYYGLPYSWGAWDKREDFLAYIIAGMNPGSHRENDCIAGDGGDPIWATGTDCSGFVSRCWELGFKHGTGTLFDVAHEIPYEFLRRGDALDDIDVTVDSGKHVVLFWKWIWANPDSFLVIEATTYGVGPGHPRNVIDTNTYLKTHFTDYKYTPIRFNYLIEPANISGDCNSDGKIDLADVIYLSKYVQGVGVPPDPLWKGDVNGDCKVNLTDVIYLCKYLFPGGRAPLCNGSCWSCV
jgi:hypothetical protein